MARDPTGTAIYDPENPLTRTWHGRPSPRTGTTGAGIQKFGTQQLKYLDTSQPALGVIEKDVGARFRLFTGGEATTPATPFSARYQQDRPNTIRTQAQLETSPHAIPLLPDFGDFEFPDLFGNGNGNGEDCGWFGEKCWGKDKETGEDCGWFGEKCWGKDKETGEDCGWFGEKCWFKPPDWNLGWVKWVLVLIGIGVLLWLLRPLFSIAKNITET